MMAITLGQKLAATFAVIAAAAVIAGVALEGGPDQQRKRRMDQMRVQRLERLKYGIEQFYRAKKRLPEKSDLASIHQNPDYGGVFDLQNWQDPVSGKSMRYQKTGSNTYMLCANFQTSDSTTEASSPSYYHLCESGCPAGGWRHPAGDYCFRLEASLPARP